MIRRPPGSTRTDTLFPYTTLFRSLGPVGILGLLLGRGQRLHAFRQLPVRVFQILRARADSLLQGVARVLDGQVGVLELGNFLLQHVFDLAAAQQAELVGSEQVRSEERRVGKECVSTCSSGWSPSHSQKTQKTII